MNAISWQTHKIGNWKIDTVFELIDKHYNLKDIRYE